MAWFGVPRYSPGDDETRLATLDRTRAEPSVPGARAKGPEPPCRPGLEAAISRIPLVLLLTACLALWPARAGAADESVERFTTGRGSVVRYIQLLPPGTVRGAAILFVGGSGQLRLGRDKRAGGSNFLVRVRHRFAARGFVVAVPDAPSDRAADGLVGWRTSDQHMADIAALARRLRGRWPAPVWLIGTSRGAISAAAGAARAPGIAGAVLVASVTKRSRRRLQTVFDAALNEITVPVFVVHHAADACKTSPPAGAGRLFGKLFGSTMREIQFIEGGRAAAGDRPCGGLSAHGFHGIEAKVVGEIVRWIGTFDD